MLRTSHMHFVIPPSALPSSVLPKRCANKLSTPHFLWTSSTIALKSMLLIGCFRFCRHHHLYAWLVSFSLLGEGLLKPRLPAFGKKLRRSQLSGHNLLRGVGAFCGK